MRFGPKEREKEEERKSVLLGALSLSLSFFLFGVRQMKSSKERQHTKKDSLLVFFDIIIIETHPQTKGRRPL